MKLLDILRNSFDLKGIVALPTILLVGGIITEIGIAGMLISYFLSQSGAGAKLSFEAMAAAESGVNDALIRIARNKNFFTSATTTLSIGSRTAEVSVNSNYAPGKSRIISIGTAFNKKRRLEAIVNINSVTGEAKVELINEVPYD